MATQGTQVRRAKSAPHPERPAKQAQGRAVRSGYILDEFTVDSDHGYGNLAGQPVSPLQAIRRYCWCCQGGHEHPWLCGDGTVHPRYRPLTEVRECKTTTCWLYPFRTGRNPNRARVRGGVV